MSCSRSRANAGARFEDTNLRDSEEVLYPIRSPIAGQIIHSDLAEGKFVEAFEHLFDIVNTEQTWVRLQLLEKDLFKVSVGNHVQLDLLNNSEKIESVVDRIDASLDAKTQTLGLGQP